VSAQPTVLVVEDTEEIADVLEAVLSAAGMAVTVTRTGPDGLAAATTVHPDVVILDLNLPGMDGVEVCRRLRATSDAYVLMLTARTDEIDRVVGLSVGADDYVTKPFSPREVQARVQALLRRPRVIAAPPAPSAAAVAETPENAIRVIGRLRIDPDARQVTVDDRHVTLTRIEFEFLDALCEQPKRVLTRAQLRDRGWGGDWLADDHAVDVHMSNLRRKLRAAGADDAIVTVRGVGYRLAST
jgi:DNA-binding response OmpR family regulator